MDNKFNNYYLQSYNLNTNNKYKNSIIIMIDGSIIYFYCKIQIN